MLNLNLPKEDQIYPASVFNQSGEYIFSGHKECCELYAEEFFALYCWNINGKPVIRKDFEQD